MKAKPKPKSANLKTKRGEAGEYVESMKVGASKWGIPVHVMKIAKAAGCPAFSGSRIKRVELEQWLLENPEAKAEGDKAATEAELKRKKLQNEVTLGDLKIAMQNKQTIPMDKALTAIAKIMAIDAEEAKHLMERDHYRVWCERTKTRVGEITLTD